MPFSTLERLVILYLERIKGIKSRHLRGRIPIAGEDAKLYSDLLRAQRAEPVITLDSQQVGPGF